MTPLVNVNLQRLNTLAVPSVAANFVRATTITDLRDALTWAQQRHVPVHLLGGGSNVLLPERIEGLVLQPALRGVEVLEEQGDTLLVRSAAGENWHRFVQFCTTKKYYGLENLSLIPGLVGAAPIQNIGAYGVELRDVFDHLQALNRTTGEVEVFDKNKCEFDYRESVFKQRLRNQYIVVSVTFRLSRTPQINDHYPAIKQALLGLKRSAITPEVIAHTVMELRRSKLPSPDQIPNVGSFFKNPVISLALFEKIREMYPDIAAYDVSPNQKKIAAGWLIEKAGWKGRTEFGVTVHEQQALVLTNPNRGPAKKVLMLAKAIQSNIKARFDIELEQEPQFIG